MKNKIKPDTNIISRIIVENFRSIYKLDINCGNINVFSGQNDAGKSNLLKALNLFFNNQTDFLRPLKFVDDYSKIALASAQRASKKKQQIKIKLFFNPPDSFRSLQEEPVVWLEKVYDRDGNSSFNYSTHDHKKKAQITRLFKKIKYFYIPALKGPDVLQYLLGKFGEHELISTNNVSLLNEEVNKKLGNLGGILKLSLISTKTSIGLPVFLPDFWQRLNVNTEYEFFDELQKKTKATKKGTIEPLKNEFYQIALDLRGEGIKSKYVPPFLQWLQQQTSDFYVWGIDEPENSLEFRKAEELANLYYGDYARTAQIFFTTHSLAFIFPSKNIQIKPSIFRCYKLELGETKTESLDDLYAEENKLSFADEIGALEVQEQVIGEWREKSKTVALQAKLIKKYAEDSKPVLYCEGPTDKEILEIAWSKIKSPNMPFAIEYCEGAKSLQTFIKNNGLTAHNRSMIALWDCDQQGYSEFKGLFRHSLFLKVSSEQVKHTSRKVYGLVLPTPQYRKNYTKTATENPQFQFLSIEHYFSDKVLKNGRMINQLANGIIFLNDCGSYFLNHIKNLPKVEFSGFNLIFDKIQRLIV